MTRFRLCLMFVLLSTAGFLLSLNGCGGSAKSLPPGSQLIQHVVVIFQENRTPDNLFHDPVLIARGADIASSGVNSQGQTITLNPIDLANNYDLGHGHSGAFPAHDLRKARHRYRRPLQSRPVAFRKGLTSLRNSSAG